MITRIAFIGYYGAGNLGDELLLQCAIKQFSEVEHKAIIFSHNISEMRESYPEAEILRKFHPIELLKGLWKSDILVFGGGSIFQDASSLKSLLYYAIVILLAKLFGKKIFLICQGIGPLRAEQGKKLCKFVYTLCAKHHISVRDKDSLAVLKDWNIEAKQFPDLVWCLPKSEQKAFKNKSLIISLRPSAKLKVEYLQALAKMIRTEYANYQVYLLAFQKSDLPPLKKISLSISGAEIKEIYTLKSWFEYGERLFKEADLCFAMRFHAVLLAIKSQTSCFGIAYDPKVSALCEQANLPYLNLENPGDETVFKDFGKLNFPDYNQLKYFSEEQAEKLKSLKDCLKDELAK